MPERLMPAESHDSFESMLSDVYGYGYAYFKAASHFASGQGYTEEMVEKYSFGWNDRYMVSISLAQGQPPWSRYYKRFYQEREDAGRKGNAPRPAVPGKLYQPDRHIITFKIPVAAEEKKHTFGIINDEAKLYLSKFSPAELDRSLVDKVVWWQFSKMRYSNRNRFNGPDTIQKSIVELKNHLQAAPDISFLHPVGDGEAEYSHKLQAAVPFHLGKEEIKKHLPSIHRP